MRSCWRRSRLERRTLHQIGAQLQPSAPPPEPRDDAIVRALHKHPTGAPRPLESIEQRAHTLRRRRRAGGVAAAALAVSIAGVPAVLNLGSDQGFTPVTTTTQADRACESAAEGQGKLLSIEQVPDEVRLLWSDSAAPRPTAARGYDFSVLTEPPNTCPVHAHVRLVEVNVDTDADGDLAALWTTDDVVTWQLHSEPAMTDSELLEFAAAVRMAVEESVPGSVWYRAAAGDSVVDLNGDPALLRTDDTGKTTVTWSPPLVS